MKNKLSCSKLIALFTFMLLGLSNHSFSNNATVVNPVCTGANITFTLSWDNSWSCVNMANSPRNFDGVWVFVKYRDNCDLNSNYPSAFTHVWLSGSDTAQMQSSTGIWFSKSMGQSTVNGTLRNMGEFIYRKYDGAGSTGNIAVTMIWDQAAQGTIGGNWDVRVVALEMVCITGTSAFKLGSGDQTLNGANMYNFSSNSTGLVPYSMTAENSAIASNAYGGIWVGNGYNASTYPYDATYPKGLETFWCMKFELTQYQYCFYLNSLDRQNQINATYIGYQSLGNFNQLTSTSLNNEAYRWVMNTSTVSSPYTPVNRQVIRAPLTFAANIPIQFGCDGNNNGVLNEVSGSTSMDGQPVAMNYLYMNGTYGIGHFLLKYLDWAALRPMDEFEFEKICRGQSNQVNYMSGESIWGDNITNVSNRNPVTAFTNSYLSTEVPTTPALGLFNGEYIGGNNTGGPLRAGCTFASNSTRETAAATYTGVADMGGNVWEWVYSLGLNGVTGNSMPVPSGQELTRSSNGDGDVFDGIPSAWNNNNSNNTYFYRGGSWNNTNYEVYSISYRGVPTGVTDATAGGRGVRTWGCDISGPTIVAGNTTATYSTCAAFAKNYLWTVPSGATITAGQGTPSITVSFACSASGNVTVTQNGIPGFNKTLVITVTTAQIPATPGSISGPTTVCNGTGTYSISAVLNATSYTWTVPSGTTVNTGQGTTSITVTFGSSSGNITVVASNNCGSSPASALSVGVNSIPSAPTANPANGISCTTFTANWSTLSGATTYYLDVSTNNSFSSFISGYNNLNVGNVIYYNITGLTASTNYYYRVRAASLCGTTGNSATITLVTSTPPPPTANAASGITCTTFTANWSTLSGTTTYYLDVATDNGFTSFVPGYNNLNIGNVLLANLTGLTAGTNYYYRVRATGSCGMTGNSATINLTTSGAPTPTANAASGISCTTFTANWSTLSGTTTYYLDVAKDNGFVNFVPGYNNLNVGNVLFANLTGLTASTNYYYRIRATGICGITGNSGTINLTTSAPIAPSASAASGIGCTMFTANWTSVTGATTYFLDVATDNGFVSFVPGYNNFRAGNVILANLTGLTASTNYYYRVRDSSICGISGNSGTITLMTPPSIPAASPASGISCGAFTANWFAAGGASSYYMDVATDNAFNNIVPGYSNLNVGNVLSANVTGLSANTNYYYQVRASGICGTSANSATITLMTTPPPVPTANAASNIAINSFTANWNAVTGATTYYLDVATDNGFVNFVSGYNNLTVGNVLFANVTGLTINTNYYYQVRAAISCGTSVNSATINAITCPPTPATPGSISGPTSAAPGSSSNVYSISSVPNATTYTWSVPSGATINSGQGTTSISVTFGTASGLISVTAGNVCGTSSAQSLVVTLTITGQVAYIQAGTYSWVCPTGVTSVCVVAIGGGGGSGAGTTGGIYNGTNSYFISTGTVCGYGGTMLQANSPGGSYTGDGGGNGGTGSNGGNYGGGGGAGGYTGAGGNGSAMGGSYGSAGSGGGGGGGATFLGCTVAAGGGGTGIYGQGSNGANYTNVAGTTGIVQGGGGGSNGGNGGNASDVLGNVTPGRGGQGGVDGVITAASGVGGGANGREGGDSGNPAPGGGGGGAYGGGGGSAQGCWGAGGGGGLGWKNNIPVTPGNGYTVVVGQGGAYTGSGGGGGGGAVRIIWGSNRSFPSTNTADQ